MRYADNGRVCPSATMWPRMVPYGAWGIGGVIKRFAPNSRFDPVRRMAPFSATSSPMDDPGRFGHLHTSLCTLHHSDARSGVEIAISRDLPQPRLPRLRRAHWRSREIAISTPDSTSELLSVEIEVFKYPKRPGLSIGDDVAENGAIRRMGYRWSNRAICTKKADLTPCAIWRNSRPHRRLWTNPAVLDIYIPHSARSATQRQCLKSRCDLPRSAPQSQQRAGEIASIELTGDRGGDRNLDPGQQN